MSLLASCLTKMLQSSVLIVLKAHPNFALQEKLKISPISLLGGP